MEKRLSAFDLKIIGIVLMTCDHIHQMWSNEGAPIWLTMLGRIVLPIFLFLSAEGFYYTRNKKKYALNLLVGFWLMGLLTKILEKIAPNPDIQLMNNIFGTLFLSILFMMAIDSFKHKKWFVGVGIILSQVLVTGAISGLMSNPETMKMGALLFKVIPSIMFTEGGFTAVILALLFYIFRENRGAQVISLLIISLLSTGFKFDSLFESNFQWMMIFAAIPILLYSGKEGRKMKWFFYGYYPVHIAVLYLFATLI